MSGILKPTNDLIFKMIFGDERNLDILADFLKAVLDLKADEFSEIAIVDPHTRIDIDSDKLSILDVKVHTKSGHIIDIEMQVSNVLQMRDRVIYYTARMITEQLSKGRDYKLNRVISIIITDYLFIDDNEYKHNRYKLTDLKTGSVFSDLIEINTLELPKLPKQTDNSPLYDWLQFLKAESEEEFTMIAERSPTIYRAVTLLKEVSQDDVVKREYELREKAVRDEHSRRVFSFEQGMEKGMEEGMEKGMEKGMEQGMEKGFIISAKNLLNLEIPIDKIMQATGLTEEKILSLKK